jgi:hypothetical protein
MLSQVNFEYLRYKLGYTRDIPMYLGYSRDIPGINIHYSGYPRDIHWVSPGYPSDILYVWWFISGIYQRYT